MKRMAEWFFKNWIWIVVGFVLQGIAIRAAFLERGYMAYGGEHLILPLILVLVCFVQQVAADIKEILQGGNGNE